MMKKEMLCAMVAVGCIANSILGMDKEKNSNTYFVEKQEILTPGIPFFLKTYNFPCLVFKRKQLGFDYKQNANAIAFPKIVSLAPNSTHELNWNGIFCEYALNHHDEFKKFKVIIKDGIRCDEISMECLEAMRDLMMKEYKEYENNIYRS